MSSKDVINGEDHEDMETEDHEEEEEEKKPGTVRRSRSTWAMSQECLLWGYSLQLDLTKTGLCSHTRLIAK